MKQRLEQYFPITAGDTSCTHLQAEVYYSLGGYNVFTGREEPRGYYLSVSPVTKSGCMVSYAAFSGSKKCVLKCERQSKKRFEEAKEIYKEWIMDMADKLFPDLYVDFTELKNAA